MTPPGRGFDSSLGFLTGGEDHWTSVTGVGCTKVCLPENDLYSLKGFLPNFQLVYPDRLVVNVRTTQSKGRFAQLGYNPTVDLTYGWSGNESIVPATALNGTKPKTALSFQPFPHVCPEPVLANHR
jgi:hypothetical protein